VVRLLVEMLEPYKGRVYDPCCGSGGMFVQSERFVEEHGGRIGDIAIYGQESDYMALRLCKMNLAVRGIDADIRWNNEGSFHRDELKDLKADYILANPPFNISDWGGDRLREDARWKFAAPPVGNANYVWLQHIVHHLAPKGTAGVVLANGSMSSAQSGEGDIRRAMVEADVVDCMIALPGGCEPASRICCSARLTSAARRSNASCACSMQRSIAMPVPAAVPLSGSRASRRALALRAARPW
jgi:type I restriction enzyme M protein